MRAFRLRRGRERSSFGALTRKTEGSNDCVPNGVRIRSERYLQFARDACERPSIHDGCSAREHTLHLYLHRMGFAFEQLGFGQIDHTQGTLQRDRFLGAMLSEGTKQVRQHGMEQSTRSGVFGRELTEQIQVESYLARYIQWKKRLRGWGMQNRRRAGRIEMHVEFGRRGDIPHSGGGAT